MMEWQAQLGPALAASVFLMVALWFVQRRTGNAGIVDVGWAFGIGVLVCTLAFFVSGDPVRRVLVASMTGLWSLRLGRHLYTRVTRENEDGRYTNLREWAGSREQAVLLGFFLIQATWIVLFALPQYVAMHNPSSTGWTDYAAVFIFAVSIIGEWVADRQLALFRNNPASQGQVCRSGLWNFSRHPNYFFEWLHWFAYPLFAIGMGSLSLIAWAGPVVMLFFLLKVTGIPPTEHRALQSRGDQYRAYQESTNAFFPWFPKELST